MAFRFLRKDHFAGPVATYTLLHFPLRHIRWALARMGERRLTLTPPPGAIFSRMLGCGLHGFSPLPDLRLYALVASWESTEAALHFFNSGYFAPYTAHTTEHYTVLMAPLQSHGQWDGVNPFTTSAPTVASPEDPLLVLTRATIHTRKLLDFWRHVPQARAGLQDSPGLLYAQGIGENPFTQQATVSIWKNSDSVKQFAYQRTAHKDIVRLTRERNWYREELFARFVPLATQGTMEGKDMLEEYFEIYT
ncbi:hypothetical protein [Telluribacter sp.]|jgi:heme-degrading monooxygenase HmoA|uniref:hypothetical protein n=1 Tax=Telluribacter sp. TaxID=1978767 RepID=UPI002E0E12C1|nr:hypothetical protein [Telluribacter sp.]